MHAVFTDALSQFARGGGGGSGGGGGGGSIIVLAGYVPMHFLGGYFRRHNWKSIGNAVVWPVAIVYSVILIFLLHGLGFIMAIGAIMGAAAGLYGLFDKLKRNKQAEKALAAAVATDPSWDVNTIKQQVSEVFVRFQEDWSNGNTESMRSYLTPQYHYHVSLMMVALAQASRVNKMTEVKIQEQDIQAVNDAADKDGDWFTMGIMASATDQLVDLRDNQVLFTDKSTFTEYWRFVRAGTGWQLAGISQATANILGASKNIQEFAASNQLYYSLDWGWLLLPRRGALFGAGKFGTSDINNHVIGVYNNLLIQIYNYVPSPVKGSSDNYLIAQVQLPKSYGEILVRRKKFLGGLFGLKGMRKISMEWQDFNSKYDVYASTAEGPTAFELLHPAFMEKLQAQPFEINMDVVDNVVYFYAKDNKVNPQNYPVMLSILQEAFKQMRM